jgi:hypothetical protein
MEPTILARKLMNRKQSNKYVRSDAYPEDLELKFLARVLR